MATYKEYNKRGSLIGTLSGVLDSVALTAVECTSGSNLLTCDSTTGVYPGMAVRAPNFPPGCFVHAVKSATVLELWRSAFDLTTGATSTSAANANATANGSALLARALGFCPQTIVAVAYFQGMWRNLHNSSGSGKYMGALASATEDLVDAWVSGYGKGVLPVPTTHSVSTNIYQPTEYSLRTSDELAVTPLKRHNGELWGVHLIVCTGGHISKVPADPEHRILYTGA